MWTVNFLFESVWWGGAQREQAESEVEYAKECLKKEREACKFI